MGEQGAGVDVDGVAAGGLHDRHAGAHQPVAEVRRRSDPVAEVVVVDHLAQALGDRLEVAAGEPAVGGEALGEDEEVAAALGQVVVVHGEPAADVGEAVLLGAHRHAVGERGHLPHDVARRSRSDCPGSRSRMNQAFSAKRQASRNSGTPWRVADRPDAAQVLQRDGLAAAGVVRDGHEHDRDVGAASLRGASSSRSRSMFPLNGWRELGSRPSGITRSTASAPVASTLARVVSKWVLFGTDLAGTAR